jgi:hypothetical protein
MLAINTLTSRAMPTTAAIKAKTWSSMPTEAAAGAAGANGAAAGATAAALGTAAIGAALGAAAGAEAAGAADVAAAAAGATGAAWAPGAGSLIAGVAVGLGGKLIRTVSFLGCTLAGSDGLGGTAPDGILGKFSAITFPNARFGGETCQTL